MVAAKQQHTLDTSLNHSNVAPLTVCLVTLGTYPHYRGGVSTWCDMLVRGLPEARFELISLVADPSVTAVYELPANVRQLTTVPLWGTSEVLELKRHLTLWQVIWQKRTASKWVIQTFLPAFSTFLSQLWSDKADPATIGQSLYEMAMYFGRFDYDTTMRSQPVWDVFLEQCQPGYARLAAQLQLPTQASLLDATNGMRLLYRWLSILTLPIPQVDVVNSAAAGLCGIPGILATQAYGTPFLLTEHGIYLRERLLALSRSQGSSFDRLFQAQFDQRLTETCYDYAAQIAPGSNYNHRWEVQNGADARRIMTIYNGPDPAELTPSFQQRPDGKPTVIWLGRIDPLKDLLTLIRAAALVHEQMPAAQFVLYGTAPKGNEGYYQECVALQQSLGLQESLIFGGFVASPEAAYNSGDFAVLSSISEGFPYSVVEAMMCGRTVVGTAVGGVPEALAGCGFVVEPRNPAQLAETCLYLLQNPALCRELGQKAREKALAHFSLQQCNASYLACYQRLATEARRSSRGNGARIDADGTG